ncbi:hypothetical protein DNTS_001694 [Danionella cerebrum]|uniref:Uncharacterized protein n=1 Tax=Danionella cerebrum TaxID=2873325 RepID=A0A553QJ66_9TELE|nr:hypothetical protein DNTS_001694 [Danionella translucida]
MSSPQNQSPDADPPKFHRLFRFYDPEVVAVLGILLGLFQVFLAVLAYTISTEVKYLFICPLCVGFVSVLAGSFGMASERTPRRELLKTSLISGLAGLMGTLIGLVVYIYAASMSPALSSCPEGAFHWCPESVFKSFYYAVSGQLLFYNSATLILHCFFTLSALKGLRVH